MSITRRLFASSLVLATALASTGATAQVQFLGGPLKRLAFQAAARQLAPMVSEASPINLDWNNLYPTVDAPPGGPFRPSGDPRKMREQYNFLVAQMSKNPGAPIQLHTGDYVFFMRAHCTHAGPQAIPAHPQEPWPESFQLAPLHGKRASILPALYGRAAQAHIPYRQTQSLVWSITNGVTYDQMPPDQQAMFTKLVPQYKSLMTGDPVKSIRDRWETMRHKMPLLPSLDAAVDKLGAVGTTIHSLEQAQQATIANANNFEQSKATLAPLTMMSPAPVPVKSWSKLNDRVYAKIKLPRNYHGIGSIIALLVRVVPATTTASMERVGKGSARDFDTIASAYSDSAGATASADFGGSIGMPAQNGVQPLTLGPAPGSVSVGPATTGDGPPPNPPPNPPRIPLDAVDNFIKGWNNFWGSSTSSNSNSNGGTGNSNGPALNFSGNDPSEDHGSYTFYATYGSPAR